MHSFSVMIAGQVLNVDAETYIGLSIAGPTELVQKISQMVRDL